MTEYLSGWVDRMDDMNGFLAAWDSYVKYYTTKGAGRTAPALAK